MNAQGQAIGAPLASWSPRAMPPRAPLVGRLCRLEPLDVARHADDLYEAFQEAPDGRDWTYMPSERLEDRKSFRNFLAEQADSTDPLHHAILVAGRPIGKVALMRIDPGNGVAEIGHVTFSRSLRKTAAATEAVSLIMGRVFDELGYRRLEWKCDSLNAPSRRAALRYGFVFEGIFRQAMVTKGRNRDTAWFAVIDADWPAIRAGLETWLAPDNFDASGRQKRALASFRRSAAATDAGA